MEILRADTLTNGNIINQQLLSGCLLKIMDTQNKEGVLPVATLSNALYVLCRFMSASDVAPEVTISSSALKTSINTPLPLKMYTSASKQSSGSH